MRIDLQGTNGALLYKPNIEADHLKSDYFAKGKSPYVNFFMNL